jgi:nucleoside-diphosphate-sugar epimerase
MIDYSNKIVQEDLQMMFAHQEVSWEKLKNKRVLITGASGMLAAYMVYMLSYLNDNYDYNVQILATVRNVAKAEARFNSLLGKEYFTLIQHDITDPIPWTDPVDYVVHAASNASPTAIINNPVGIINANTIGTQNLLEFYKEKQLENFLFLSTREVYGTSPKELVDEEAYGGFDILSPRSCYPESKRMAETLLSAYHAMYDMPFTVARIAHSYGPGMELANDGRIMSDLLNNVIEKEDIVLKSEGTAERAFCYVSDAVVGLFVLLLNADNTNAYNIGNEDEPIMIRDLAQKLTTLFSDKGIKVVFDIPKTASIGYSKMGRTVLNTTKLETLGWTRSVSLDQGLVRTVKAVEM